MASSSAYDDGGGGTAWRILLASFGFGYTALTVLLTVLAQVVAPSGYSSKDAGIFGILLITIGFLGAIVVGAYLDMTRYYRRVYIVTFFIACLLMIGFVLSILLPKEAIDSEHSPIEPRRLRYIVGALLGLIGFVSLGLMPTAFDSAVEMCYPIREEIASGLLMTFATGAGIIGLAVISVAISDQKIRLYIIVACAGVGWFLSFFFSPRLRRLEAERELEEKKKRRRSRASAPV